MPFGEQSAIISDMMEKESHGDEVLMERGSLWRWSPYGDEILKGEVNTMDEVSILDEVSTLDEVNTINEVSTLDEVFDEVNTLGEESTLGEVTTMDEVNSGKVNNISRNLSLMS
ncbi:hypothetical protein Acr_00g0100810 [Actinidia rufa]|uniref:Uncharacterized protein n=1 Tax=Actinidia rufa TaxID=165716 RepID=A0A7J0E103_9ERIC|nr:hypothetical protein Acr_00g0100810 [Actinidia rufa]